MSSSISPKNEKILWGKSGNRCAMCNCLLTEKKADNSHYTLGKGAHIEGEKPSSARYRKEMTDKERNNYNNLILLCGTCHDKIDNDEQAYTVDIIKEIKAKHEKFVETQTLTSMLDVTFAELEVVLNYLISGQHGVTPGALQAIPPPDKIKKNSLDSDVENLLRMGLTQEKQIDEYLNKNLDMNFAEKLRTVFIDKYEELKSSGLESNALFYEFLDFATNGRANSFKHQAAGLAVLSYYFNMCDVFEK